MAEFYDPQTALVTDWRSFFVEHRDDMFVIPCEEGHVELKGSWMFVNILMCMPLIKRYRPISRDKHLYTSGIYDASLHSDIQTAISRSLEEMGYTREELGHDILMTVNDMHNACFTHLGSFIRTIDIFSIADTVLQEEAEKVCTVDYGDIEDGNINRMEAAFKEQAEVMYDLLISDKLKVNVFRGPLLCGALKKGQFLQHVLSAGPKSDTDDKLFYRPVEGSFLSGMRNIMDLAIESRSASKATFYNKTRMSTTQYMNRKIHLLNSVISHLYRGDCGSTLYGDYEPNHKTVKMFTGKFFLSDSGELLELTPERFDMVINKLTKFRDIPECRYTDGYCEVCGGTITKSYSVNGNVGYISNVNTGAPVAQQVLSTKHLTGTDAAEYEVPYALHRLLMSEANDIYIRPHNKSKMGQLVLGFLYTDIQKLNDLKYYVTENELHPAYFTDIKYMSVGTINANGNIRKEMTRTPMGGKSKAYPHFSPEILSLLREHPEDLIIQDGMAWLSLKNVDITKPIMACSVVNNSISRFVDRFRDLVTRDVERYTSVNDFMRDLTKLIWSKGINTHVTHISCIAKACMITSRKDFRVPEMTDPNNVMFGSLGKIIPMRSIGANLAFERFNLTTNRAWSSIIPKPHGDFDEYLGPTDLIIDNMTFPVITDSEVMYD